MTIKEKTIIVIHLLLFSFSQALFAQGIPFSNLGPEDGLSQSSVSHMIQDAEGIMWFATQVGIDRYDGQKFDKVTGLPKRLVNKFSLLKDYNKKYLLAGIHKQLFFIDKVSYEAEVVCTLDTIIIDIFEREVGGLSHVLFTENKMYKVSKSFKEIENFHTFDLKIKQVLQIDPNRYLLSQDTGLYELFIDSLDIHIQPIDTSLKVNALYRSEMDPLIYIGLDAMKLLIYDYGHKPVRKIAHKLIPKPMKHEFSGSPVTSLYIEEGMLWMGTERSGLYLYELSKSSKDSMVVEMMEICHAYCRKHQILSSNKIKCITTSKDGVIWVGTEAGGISYRQKSKQQFDHFFKRKFIASKKDGTGDTLYAFNNYALGLLIPSFTKDSLLMVGSWDGLAIIPLNKDNPRGIHRFRSETKDPNSLSVLSIAQPNPDSIILGTGKGLYFLPGEVLSANNQSIKEYTYIESSISTKAVSILHYQKDSSRWWVASRAKNVIYRLNQNFSTYDILSFQVGENISFIQEVRAKEYSGMLIGTSKGAYFHDGDTSSIPLKKHVICATLELDGQHLWLGTDRAGLFKLNILQNTITDSIGKADGLEPDVIYAVFTDSSGKLWMSSNHGILRIDTDSTPKLINKYTEKDNLQNGEFNSGSAFCADDYSRFFFGGINGITSFEAQNQKTSNPKTNSPNPSIRFSYPGNESFAVYLAIGDTTITTPRLPVQFNYLKVLFSLPNYQDSRNNQFKFTLNDEAPLFGKKGEFTFPQKSFARQWPFRKNKLIVHYRSGTGQWNDKQRITFQIPRKRFSTGGKFLLFFIILLLIALAGIFILRQYNLRKLTKVQMRINEVSRLESTKGLTGKAKEHLIKDFEYVIFSFVDFNNRRIISEDSDCVNPKIVDPKLWLDKSNYSLDDMDILSQIVRQRESVIVFRNEILNPAIDPEGALNKEISSKYGHDQLARLYVPIVHRALKQEEHLDTLNGKQQLLVSSEGNAVIEDVVIGVIEAGFKLSLFQYPRRFRAFTHAIIPDSSWLGKFISPLEYLRHKEIQLKLYVDNFAQPYYRALLKQNRKKFYDQTVDPAEDKHFAPFDFVKNVLHNIAQKIGADYGFVAFRTFNNKDVYILERNNVFYGKRYNQKYVKKAIEHFSSSQEDKKGIIRYVSSDKVPYYSNNVKDEKERYYIKAKKDIQSEMALPMKDKYDVVYGVFSFSSTQKGFFNKLLLDTLKKVVEKSTDSFLRKKESNTLSQLTTPFDIFSRSNDRIYLNAVEALENYFYSDYICIWERDKTQIESNLFNLSTATSPGLKAVFKTKKYTSNNLSEKQHAENVDTPIQIQHVENYPTQKARIYKICRSLEFQSYIVISIVVEKRIEGFINIFSKRRIENKELPKLSEEFLKSFSKKLSMAIQHAQLISSFTRISESLSKRHEENPLQIIVDQAYEVMPSTNSIVLFPYNGEEITMENIYRAGSIPKSDVDSKKRANVANYVIDNNTQWITSEEENEKIASSIKPMESERLTFWKTMNIKSVAAVRLEYEKSPIGVMFFNYNEERAFNTYEEKRIINAFTNLATTALINEKFIQRLQRAATNLEQQISTLKRTKESIEIDKKKIENEKRELEIKMDELLPRAASASYFLILQGVNHDIRNFLLDIQARLKKIDPLIYEKDKEVIAYAMHQVNNKMANIRNLLKLFDFRDDKGEESIAVNETIQGVVNFFKNGSDFKEVSFKTTFGDNIPALLYLKAAFSMIIYNLINNAVHAMDNQGTILIKTWFKNKFYHFQIEDNGVGFDNKLQDEIFKFGYTTKEEGMGIGLFFVKKTIEEKLKGKVDVKSSKNKGTKFTIIIPEYINYNKH